MRVGRSPPGHRVVVILGGVAQRELEGDLKVLDLVMRGVDDGEAAVSDAAAELVLAGVASFSPSRRHRR